jgi:WD40 repeat protein
MALAAHPDGERFASSGADGRVRFWSQAGEEISKAAVSKLALLALGYSPDGKLIGAGGLEGQLILLNERGRIQHRFPTYQAGITALGFVPGQDLVATAGSDGSVKVWDYRGRLLRSEEQALGSHLHGLAIHPAGTQLAVGGDGGSLRLVRISDLNGLLRSGCQWLQDSLQREASFMDLRKDCQTIPQESTGRWAVGPEEYIQFIGAASFEKSPQPIPAFVEPLFEKLASQGEKGT